MTTRYAPIPRISVVEKGRAFFVGLAKLSGSKGWESECWLGCSDAGVGIGMLAGPCEGWVGGRDSLN